MSNLNMMSVLTGRELEKRQRSKYCPVFSPRIKVMKTINVDFPEFADDERFRSVANFMLQCRDRDTFYAYLNDEWIIIKVRRSSSLLAQKSSIHKGKKTPLKGFRKAMRSIGCCIMEAAISIVKCSCISSADDQNTESSEFYVDLNDGIVVNESDRSDNSISIVVENTDNEYAESLISDLVDAICDVIENGDAIDHDIIEHEFVENDEGYPFYQSLMGQGDSNSWPSLNVMVNDLFDIFDNGFTELDLQVININRLEIDSPNSDVTIDYTKSSDEEDLNAPFAFDSFESLECDSYDTLFYMEDILYELIDDVFIECEELDSLPFIVNDLESEDSESINCMSDVSLAPSADGI